MVKTFLFAVCVSAVALVFSGTGLTQTIFGNDSSTLRCSNGLIGVGDKERDVTRKCGIPKRLTREGPYKIYIYQSGPSRFKNYVIVVDRLIHRIVSGPCEGDDVDCQ